MQPDYHQSGMERGWFPVSNAQKCYEKLGIKLPQQELRGTYSKPVWDPKSTIWQPEKSTN